LLCSIRPFISWSCVPFLTGVMLFCRKHLFSLWKLGTTYWICKVPVHINVQALHYGRVVVQRLYINDNIRLMGDQRGRKRRSHFSGLVRCRNWVVGTVNDSTATMLWGKPYILVSLTLWNLIAFISVWRVQDLILVLKHSQDIEQFQDQDQCLSDLFS